MGEIWGRYTCVAEEVGDDEDDVEQDGLGDIGEIWGRYGGDMGDDEDDVEQDGLIRR